MAWRNWPAYWDGMGLSSSADPGFIHWFASGKTKGASSEAPSSTNQTNTTNCRQYSTAARRRQPLAGRVSLKIFLIADHPKQFLIQADAIPYQHDNGVVGMRHLRLNQPVLDALDDGIVG